MSLKTGWCIGAQDCDTDTERGGCPIRAGQNPPCDCTCHDGATERRPHLANRKIPARERAEAQEAGAYA